MSHINSSSVISLHKIYYLFYYPYIFQENPCFLLRPQSLIYTHKKRSRVSKNFLIFFSHKQKLQIASMITQKKLFWYFFLFLWQVAAEDLKATQFLRVSFFFCTMNFLFSSQFFLSTFFSSQWRFFFSLLLCCEQEKKKKKFILSKLNECLSWNNLNELYEKKEFVDLL